MGVSKVIYYGETLVDMEHVTVTPETLGEGETALDASGELIQGTAKIGGTELPGLTNPGAAADLLRGKQLIDEDGNIVDGTMINWGGGVNAYLSRNTTSYTISKGHHDGTGKVNVNVETLEVTPSKKENTYLAPVGSTTNPSASKLYGAVKVKAIPDQYQDVTPVTATDDHVFAGDVFVDAQGNPVSGTFTIDAEITEQDSLLAQIRTALVGKTAGGGGLPTQEKTVEITENGTHEILPDDGYGLSKAVINVNVEASGGASEYYTITNNTGLDLVICDHVVTAGTTVDIPVDVNTMREMGGYLLVHSWLVNVITPTKTYIVATVNGSVPTQSPKNRINRITFYVGSQSYAAFMAGVDIATLSGSTLVQPASGSTIVLTLSA